jgi:hypothetical protein
MLVVPKCPLAQEAQTVAQTTVCEVVNSPLDFSGKLIEIRARLWSTGDQVWINDSAAGSKEIGESCEWIRAEFTYQTDLTISTAYGTFAGRLLYEPSRKPLQSGTIKFVIERDSDIYRQELLNGPLTRPVRFDTTTRRFIFHPW